MLTRHQDALKVAKQHARRKFPHRICGLIIDGSYRPVKNVAINTKTDYQFPNGLIEDISPNRVDMIVASQTNKPYLVEAQEVAIQDKYNRPFAFIALNKQTISEPVIWGAETPIPPIIGRRFIYGVTDCYTIVRDCFRLGKYELKKQGIDGWPYEPTHLPVIPSNDGWWNEGEDYYVENFKALGFRQIDFSEARPGDGFLTKFNSDKYNHAALLISPTEIVHHLPARLSRREKVGLWGRNSDLWLRYAG